MIQLCPKLILFFGLIFESFKNIITSKSFEMKFKTIIVATAAVATVATTAQSCLALATSTVGLAVLKKVLLGGITKGLGIFGNKQAFLENNLIDQALPKQLRDLNVVLEKIAPNLVAKERDYIAQAAVYTVDISKPILTNAVNS